MTNNKFLAVNKAGILLLLFCLGVGFHIYTLQVKGINNSPITKSLPIIILSLLVLNQRKKTYRTYLMTIALLLCALGDVILDLGRNFFLFGVAGFALAHSVYILAFKEKFIFTFSKILPLFFLISISFFTIFKLVPYSGDLSPLLLLYFSILLMFGITVIFNKSRNTLSYLGVVAFIVSDSLLVYDRFVHSFEYRNILVISIYYLAQLLIVTGFCSTYKETFIFNTSSKKRLIIG